MITYAEVVYLVFLIIFTVVFMYQRTTLNIARKMNKRNVMEMQLILTPNWIGLLGWTSYGVYIGCILVGLKHGLLMGILAFVLTIIITSVVPIPYKQLLGIVIDHLEKERRKKGNEEVVSEYTHLLKEIESFKHNLF